MKLTNVEIHKFKSIETNQSFKIEDDITVLVGMNEAGKTSVLEAIAKVNYFTNDKNFKFDTTHDYPRKEKKKLDKSGENPTAITLSFTIDDTLLQKISDELGVGVFNVKNITYSKKYDNSGQYIGVHADLSKFLDFRFKNLSINDISLIAKLKICDNKISFTEILEAIEDEDVQTKVEGLEKYFENINNWKQDSLSEYIARVFLGPNMPKLLYYDEYYALPSQVLIEDLATDKGDKESGEYKTA